MAHFAQLDSNNVVIGVFAVDNADILDDDGNEVEQLGIDICKATVDPSGTFIQTSFNGNFRIRYASLGGVYDPLREAFIPPCPYNSFVFNETTLDWDAPVPYPDDGKHYYWDESILNWVQIPGSEGE